MTKLEELTNEYLLWLKKKDEAEEKLEGIKEEIVVLAKEKNVKKIKSGKTLLLIVSQSETRFPQLGKQGRKELEEIIKNSGELEGMLTFDIIKLGNAYDEGKLNKELMEKLKPYAKREKTTKIVVKIGKS